MAMFSDMVDKFLEVFMDDFSIFGPTFDDCLQNLTKVFKRYMEMNLVWSWKKSHFMFTRESCLDTLYSRGSK